MKKIIKNLVYGLIVGAGAIFASCSTTDEIMDSIPYDRVLTPQKFDATVVRTSGTDVTFTWLAVSNADKYILEVFNAIELSGGDSETYSVDPADYEGATPVWSSEDIKSDEIPVTVGFDVDKTYFARVRGISSKVENSGWVYLEKVFSTYPVRPSLNPVVVTRTTSEITIAWDDAEDKADLSTFEIVPVSADDVEATVITVTSADIEACTKSFSGLNAGTEYKITLIYGKGGERGSVAAWTRPDMGQVVKVSTVQDIYKNINGATGEVRLEIAYNDGAEYNFAEVLTDPETGGIKALSVGCNLYIYGETTVDGKKPVFSNVEFSLNGTSKALHVEDLVLDGKKTIGATASVAANSDIDVIEFLNCEMYDYTKGIYSVAGTVVANVSKILFKGVYAHDINADGSVGGDFIDIRGGYNPDVEIANSTFSFCARTFLRISDSAKGGKASVTNCTFNSVTATPSSSNNAGIFHIRETTETSEIYMSNCLFLNMVNALDQGKGKDGWIRIARNNATQSYAPACDNNYYYNVSEEFFTTQAMVPQTGEHLAPSNDIIAAPATWTAVENDPCVNSEIGKLYLRDDVISANHIGDPRWWSAVQPVVIRATELETVKATTEWDFTAKAKFETESVAENTIIENIRIYAPAEVVSGTGIKFNAASTVSATGRPSASALAFKADGYGSVTVLTEDGGYNASVHVVVGSDRITLPADGKAHKAVFGDLVGENEIFVLAGSPVTIVSVTWTAEDAEAENTKTALAAPKVSVEPSSITVGNEDGINVVASWAAVENAATYEVTFNGKTTETAETSFVIAAVDAAVLSINEYEISVIAKPVATSSKYMASEAAVATFTVKAKPAVGAPVTWTWDFSSAEWQAAFETAAPEAKGTNQTDWTVSLDGLTYTSGTGNGKWDANGFIQPNGGGSKTSRVFTFTAPADGTLKITAQSANSSDTRDIVVVDSNEKEQTQGVLTQTELVYDVVAGEVYIYPKGGIRFYKIEFTYIDSSATAEPTVWDFSKDPWASNQDVLDLIAVGSTGSTTFDLTLDGLRVYAGGSLRAGTGYFQSGGGGNMNSRCFSFTATSSGTLKVTSSNTSGSEDMSRLVKVQTGDDTANTKEAPGGYASGSQVPVEYNINVSEPTKIYIYPSGGLRFYVIEFDGGVEK